MDTMRVKEPADLAAATTEELQGWATHLMVGDELGEIEFSRLRQMAQDGGWQPGASLPSREELHEYAFPRNHARIRQNIRTMQRDALQRYVHDTSAVWTKRR